MQTLAEKFLIEKSAQLLPKVSSCLPRILNVGAGSSLVLETAISNLGKQFVADRVDVEDCKIESPLVENSWNCSVENMSCVATESYDLAISNFVFEHLKQVEVAVKEVARVLKPGGYFILTVPNPRAPEFLLARVTKKKTHEKIKKAQVWPTYYQYKSIKNLAKIFEKNDLRLVEKKHSSFVQDILCRYPGMCFFAKAYDKIVNTLKLRFLMGHVCLVFKK